MVSSFKSLVFWFSCSLFLFVSKDRFFLFLVVERLGRQDLASPRPPLLPATAPIRLAQNLFSPKNCFEPQNPGLKRQGLAASLDGQCTDKIRKSWQRPNITWKAASQMRADISRENLSENCRTRRKNDDQQFAEGLLIPRIARIRRFSAGPTGMSNECRPLFNWLCVITTSATMHQIVRTSKGKIPLSINQLTDRADYNERGIC